MEVIKITDRELIGSGGNWKVYEGNLLNETDDPVIIKTNDKISEYKINGNIKNYELIKSLGLPTLKFFRKAKIDKELAIVAENLNNISDVIYVTPNSVITIQNKKMDQITGKKRIESKAEQKLYDNKISTINNLLEFIQDIKIKLAEISRLKVILEYDCYFLGISNQNILDYKIADFDTIFECDDKSTEECYQINLDELKRVLMLFIEYFIIETEQSELSKIVNENLLS
ncbi:hypothetical protein FEDK69T_18620 [Flavobacterium enshiense DK69]|uniref:Uncharacterized protein n=1 Tax=Flavobacterium enshiense DK69 TaxID=1107311 RepID=V6S8N3_9FLAO|nr:hypothetical protein [Flavobacterium enshiense]ESU22607.1 hypothetical protein FEDK69T_18620 [Flavobacterium enshiense DK69]KGO95680.1 hypothetical protein Q767_10715 [Flavobacterium enshiense DK69]